MKTAKLNSVHYNKKSNIVSELDSEYTDQICVI